MVVNNKFTCNCAFFESRLTLSTLVSLQRDKEPFDLIPDLKYCHRMDNQETIYSIRNCIFGFQCTRNWDEMSHASSSGDDTEVRFCSGCEKEVYQCATDEELTRNVQLNRCVVIARSTDAEDEMLLGIMRPTLVNDDRT